MRHFATLSASEIDRLFFRAPEDFGTDSDPHVLAMALGATLYSPGTRPRLAEDIAKRAAAGVVSVVVCLEDSISDDDVPAAERNVVAQLRAYAQTGATGPLVFVRVRNPEQIPLVADGLGEHLGILAGFVVPKFLQDNGIEYLEAIEAVNARSGRRLYAMPVLESPTLAFAETRSTELAGIQTVLQKYRDTVLAVRIGATDLSAAFGLRRNRELTIYHVHVIAAVIADIVNVLGRADETGFVITGPVWEYFAQHERLFKPQLRETPFAEHDEEKLRQRMIADDLDGLIREVVLDQANGLTGKTVIHPSHVAAVHALSVVSHEEYVDACDVLAADRGGAKASEYRNKMNESKPHRAWATQLLRRAQVFGVIREDVSFVDVLSASQTS
ncbi:HpcH/HpaI aldolase/citrate lyase family protein [Sanguibacter suaedae]|uniref:HpcH/HpaI aldolase/citrate lyase family protein n=1 Tax=Sanguibacter suaedae TaxID=2795737 RepID=A0A934MBX3_9MICO|nr:HpcH/HpaI aldolase/citrate lyase family protein [Sanguibacter suaedae]MBI9115781.1 HpcH/HpaI aldolase/citrate lyase family protein [Sanguibacter suaedae]